MNSKLVSLFCCLIMLVSFSGCTKVTQLVKDNQPTKADLLAEINEEHRRWEGGSSDPTPICGITMTPPMPRNQLIISPTPTANTMPPKN